MKRTPIKKFKKKKLPIKMNATNRIRPLAGFYSYSGPKSIDVDSTV